MLDLLIKRILILLTKAAGPGCEQSPPIPRIQEKKVLRSTNTCFLLNFSFPPIVQE